MNELEDLWGIKGVFPKMDICYWWTVVCLKT